MVLNSARRDCGSNPNRVVLPWYNQSLAAQVAGATCASSTRRPPRRPAPAKLNRSFNNFQNHDTHLLLPAPESTCGTFDGELRAATALSDARNSPVAIESLARYDLASRCYHGLDARYAFPSHMNALLTPALQPSVIASKLTSTASSS